MLPHRLNKFNYLAPSLTRDERCIIARDENSTPSGCIMQANKFHFLLALNRVGGNAADKKRAFKAPSIGYDRGPIFNRLRECY